MTSPRLLLLLVVAAAALLTTCHAQGDMVIFEAPPAEAVEKGKRKNNLSSSFTGSSSNEATNVTPQQFLHSPSTSVAPVHMHYLCAMAAADNKVKSFTVLSHWSYLQRLLTSGVLRQQLSVVW